MHYSVDFDHCLPFWHSLRWRALRWDVTRCCAPCWWSCQYFTLDQMCGWTELVLWLWWWWRYSVFLCLSVCGHLQKRYCHFNLALTPHIDHFRNVPSCPFPVCFTRRWIIQGSWKFTANSNAQSVQFPFKPLTKIHPCLSTVAVCQDLSEIMSTSSFTLYPRISWIFPSTFVFDSLLRRWKSALPSLTFSTWSQLHLRLWSNHCWRWSWRQRGRCS